MPASERSRRWFRIAYAGNALRRMLAEKGTSLETMTAAAGIHSMFDFMAHYQPQHGESDELWCSWGPRDGVFEFVISRRMTRHGHPDASVSIVLAYRPTPARMALSGDSAVQQWRDATGTVGYRAIASARPLECRIDEKRP